MISVSLDEQSYRDMQATLRRLRQELPRAAVSAMSKSLTKVKNLLVDESYKTLNLTKSRLAQDISLTIEGDISGGNLDKFKMAVNSKGKPIGLVWFVKNHDWAWQNPTDIKVKIYRSGKTHSFRHAFLAKGKGASLDTGSGAIKQHMWSRENWSGKAYRPGIKYWNLPHNYRFPLRRLSTIRIQDIQDKPAFAKEIMEKASSIILKDVSLSADEVLKNA